MLKGIDISHHQKGIDLGSIETDFVICKATEGNGYTDECCDSFYQKAKSLGKKLGIYHFARPDLGNTAVAEADWFLKETKGYHKEAILILDWEQKALNYSTSWAKAWLDRVYEKTGVKPVLYIQASALSQDWSAVAKADYGLWVANYGSNNGTPQESVFNRYPLKHWSFYALWQYTSKGRLNGYNGDLDLNYFNGDTSAWDKYAGGSPSSGQQSTNSGQENDTQTTNSATQTYTVKKGDTLSGIASKYGTTYQELARINGIANPDKIYPGQVIKINGSSTSITYTVQKGDTLTAIAKKYGTTINKIANDNNIADPNKIYTGQKLVIK